MAHSGRLLSWIWMEPFLGGVVEHSPLTGMSPPFCTRRYCSWSDESERHGDSRRSQGLPKIFRAPTHTARRAVIFAIAQLSCTAWVIMSPMLDVWRNGYYDNHLCRWIRESFSHVFRSSGLLVFFAELFVQRYRQLSTVVRVVHWAFLRVFLRLNYDLRYVWVNWVDSTRSRNMHGSSLRRTLNGC